MVRAEVVKGVALDGVEGKPRHFFERPHVYALNLKLLGNVQNGHPLVHGERFLQLPAPRPISDAAESGTEGERPRTMDKRC